MHFLPRLEITQDGLYKNYDDDQSEKIENVLDILTELDPIDQILLNLIDKVIEKVESNREKINEIESAIEWIKRICST